MFTLPLFAGWRIVWEKDQHLASAARDSDRLAEQRNELKVPITRAFNWKRSDISTVKEISDLCRHDSLDMLIGSAPQVAKWIVSVEDLLDASFWPRWLELEDALAQCSVVGDLLLAAITLRTQLEELAIRKRTLAAKTTAHQVHRGNCSPESAQRLAELAMFLHKNVLPRLQPLTEEEILAHPKGHRLSGEHEDLIALYDSLGDYVHPNYGSHVLTLRAESSVAAGIVLRGFVAVYSELSLITPRAFGMPAPKHKPDFKQSESGLDLLIVALPKLFEDPAMVRYVREGLDEFRDTIRTGAETAEHLPSLVDLSDATILSEDIVGRIAEMQGIVAPASVQTLFDESNDLTPVHLRAPINRVFWFLVAKSARRLEEIVARLEPALGPGGTGEDISAWLDLVVQSLSLALNLTELKILTLADEAARLIARNNGLGATLAVRSILEHHCVLIELGKKVDKQWQDAQVKKDTRALLELLESNLGRFLSGTKQTAEAGTGWFGRWNKAGKCLNVNDAVESAEFEPAYARMSKTIHGETYRGGDLLGDGGAQVQKDALRHVTLALADLLSTDLTIARARQASLVAHESSITLAREAESFEQMRQILQSQRLPEKYSKGKHVRGSGSKEEPIRFSRLFPYMKALIDYSIKQGWSPEHLIVWDHDRAMGHAATKPGGELVYFLDDPF